MSDDTGSRPMHGPLDGPAGGAGPELPGLPEQPDAGQPSDVDGPIGTRLGHDPSGLGGEVANEGDLVYPTPEDDSPKSM
jgi:hypothetical protein